MCYNLILHLNREQHKYPGMGIFWQLGSKETTIWIDLLLNLMVFLYSGSFFPYKKSISRLPLLHPFPAIISDKYSNFKSPVGCIFGRVMPNWTRIIFLVLNIPLFLAIASAGHIYDRMPRNNSPGLEREIFQSLGHN